MSDEIFSISKAAKYLGVFPLTLRNWEKKGLISSFRTPGGHRRFRRSDLDRITGCNKSRDRLEENIKKLEEMDLEKINKQVIDRIISSLRDLSEGA